MKKKRRDKKSNAWIPIRNSNPDELYGELVRRHPQYRRALERGETVIEDGVEVNPEMHLQLHLIVERQLLSGDPDFVREAAIRLERHGVHPHDVRHLLALPLVDQVFTVVKTRTSYDRDKHRKAVEEILAEHC